MTWVYEVLEIHDRRRRPMGKYRVVRWDNSVPDHLEGLCSHSHDTPDEALRCSQVTKILDHEFRERISPNLIRPTSS